MSCIERSIDVWETRDTQARFVYEFVTLFSVLFTAAN